MPYHDSRPLLALSHVLEELAPTLSAAGEILFLRARFLPELYGKAWTVTSHQTWKPHFDELNAARVSPIEPPFSIPRDDYSFIIYLGTKSRDENLSTFRAAFDRLREGGQFLCVMDNDLGAARFEKALRGMFGNGESRSKHHCRAFWAIKGRPFNEANLAEARAAGREKEVAPGILAPAGVFSASEIDAGTKLLISQLPPLSGTVVDLGAGYGALSRAALEKGDVESLINVEAEWLALDACRRNIERVNRDKKLRFVWHDLRKTLPDLSSIADFVLMNPPFHEGSAVDASVSESFVRRAHEALKAGGELWMVANEHLRYGKMLAETFGTVTRVAHEGGFFVFRCVR